MTELLDAMDSKPRLRGVGCISCGERVAWVHEEAIPPAIQAGKNMSYSMWTLCKVRKCEDWKGQRALDDGSAMQSLVV